LDQLGIGRVSGKHVAGDVRENERLGTHPAAHIEVRAGLEPGVRAARRDSTISVRNGGPMIAPADLQRLCEQFQLQAPIVALTTTAPALHFRSFP
jgi:hypothetical protein